MASLSKLNQIAKLDWEPDSENEGGYVAEVARESLQFLQQNFLAAGYDVSSSRDDDGRYYIWVA